MAQAGTQSPFENKVPTSVTVMSVFHPVQLKLCSDWSRWDDTTRNVKTDDSAPSIPFKSWKK